MLQNRVAPNGNIIITPARGAWMGNRGQLHDSGKAILRPFKLKAWLICQLEFKDWKRKVMSPRLYTELFFFDEATAFAAGHRPCFECRRKAYDQFKHDWLKGNPGYGFHEKTSIREIDAILHHERIGEKNQKITFNTAPHELPDGTFIQIEDQPYLVADNSIHHWTPFGYDQSSALPDITSVTVLTPKSTINAFRAGYQPQMAISG